MCKTQISKGLSYKDMTDKTKHFYDNYCRDGLLIPMEPVIRVDDKIKAWSIEMKCVVLIKVTSIKRGGWIGTQSVIDKTQYIICRFIDIHGNKYGYKKVDYTGDGNKVIIICKDHGEFEQTPSHHLRSQGCRKCANISIGNSKRSNTEDFIKKSIDIHGNKYGYKKVNYIGDGNKVIITCDIHGDFKQTPRNHLKGHGCQICANIVIGDSKRSNIDDFIKKSIDIHGLKYGYKKVDYIKAQNKVIITCDIHGDFKQSPMKHLSGQGCVTCGHKLIGDKLRSNTIEFIEKAKDTHGLKYGYKKVDYINSQNKVIITCDIHGDFKKDPAKHLTGEGCPTCQISKGEILLSEYLQENNINFINQKKFPDCRSIRPLPFDFYLPNYNLCIEYDGRQHFGPVSYWDGEEGFKRVQKHDKIKNDYCKENGINLLRIPYTNKDNINEILDTYFSKLNNSLYI